MSRSTFIAARNSRHRTAALALYRALLRTASKVPVPLENAAQKASKDIKSNPVVRIVRKRFAKNKPYTSFRLIYAAMTAGYKFLNLLTNAQTPNSPEHNQVINHLQSVRQTAAASRAVPQPPRRPDPILPPEPLLINVAKADQPPKYTSNILPRPRDSLKGPGPRKVPSVSATADGQPFVRLRKPQPHAMSKMIGRKTNIFNNRILNILDVDEWTASQAALEDEWDRMMDKLLAKEKPEKMESQGFLRRPYDKDSFPMGETFGWSVQLSRLWWEWKVEKTWEDWTARGEALNDLVEQERSLAEKERGGSEIDLLKKDKSRATARLRRDAQEFDDAPPNVAVSDTTGLPLLEALRGNLSKSTKPMPNEVPHDPFLSLAWATLVKAEQGRMLMWARRHGVRSER
ncbi:uncharacterized protein TrAtP1_002904 [Trichoderma atroviride]|uniref:Complex 1 LYR protein domain-containing protein n=1 Tax=Hypocrea atroviridis (strain ATCC 20476 / IMI 206040) TaxID=452589 RepID=G9NXH1_HYPAI|nr:uncharacterized protein TRIATDRAFT_318364 [Trichoderma atroviride IMI 206040]EHK44779.1 hypothetical protein TRIATDRAFT_318364 [Trichoderma atroviride IMI 206040]UKZ61646.1 hypothetical protein TrAtP1_002904 [Trichoderma atroviride]